MRGQKGEYRYLVNVAESQPEEGLFFPGKDSDNEKSWALFTGALPTFFPFL